MLILLNVLGVASVESAVIGMAILSMVLVGITFHGGFLYFSRPADG